MPPQVSGGRRGAQRYGQALFFTLPLRIHRVQARIRRTPPPIDARTSLRLGFHRRLVLLFAWLTLLPTDGPLPQIAHCLIDFSTSELIKLA
jgi:hypothetical protein